MSDWHVGDLAVCVRVKKRRPGEQVSDRTRGEIGKIYRVIGLATDCNGNFGLVLDGKWSRHPSGAFLASGFRKIRPDDHEGCEPEFVTLLKRSKAPSTKERETRILEALFPESPTERAGRSNASRDMK